MAKNQNNFKRWGYCDNCGKYFTIPKRQGGNNQRFCSKKCRYQDQSQRHKEYRNKWGQRKRGEYAPNKVQCLICGKWYVQVCSHTYAVHGLKGREYRELMGLDVKRGVVPEWYREMKGEIALENGTYKNLNRGKEYRYEKNDPRLQLYGKGRGY